MEKKSNTPVILALLLLGAVLLIAAGRDGNPLGMGTTLERLRAGMLRVEQAEYLTSTSTSTYFRTNAGSAAIACYPDRSTLVLGSKTNASTCCIVMASNGVTIGAQGAQTAPYVTDPNGPDGNGACVTLAAGERYPSTLDIASARTSIGARQGVCSNYVSASNAVQGYRVRPPCRIDADCIVAGCPSGTTCNTSPTQADFDESCLFALCRTETTNTVVTAISEH